MSSRTLGMIAKHWNGPLPQETGYTDLPFSIEDFCRENDALIDDALGALEPFAKLHLTPSQVSVAQHPQGQGCPLWGSNGTLLTAHDVLRAQAVLAKWADGKGEQGEL
jgi:hypothetical protein